MTELRKTEGTPIWLPPGVEHPHLVKREKRAYGADDGGAGQALVETGLLETGARFVFRCPLCGRQERNDQRLEPMCTGPSWTDDHPPEPMIRVA
jgi:hypothetical protein